MLSRNAIKYIQSLKSKKFRKLYGAFIVEGEKSVEELLRGKLRVDSVYAVEDWMNAHRHLLNSSLKAETIGEDDLGRISDLKTPNKVLAVAGIPDKPPFQPEDYDSLILALDGIRDPGNMGTILRTADWFGIRKVVCSEDCVDVFNPKVVQASMGSFARVVVYETDLTTFLRSRPEDIPVYGALLSGESITGKKFPRPGILIIGNESQGISAALLPEITDPVFIPPVLSTGKDHAESLNASIANAIICYEISKQLFENKF